MKMRNSIMIVSASVALILLLTQVCPAARGGGGGGGGARMSGGGGARMSGGGSRGFSGGGSVRYAGGGGARPSVPSAAPRPAAPPTRPAAPATRPAAPATRPSTPATRPVSSAGVGNTYRPANMGSITTRPSGSAPSSGKVINGPGGGTWGIAQGPNGGMVIGHQRPGGGGSISAVGPGGARGGIAVGPGGGIAGRVTGPGGGSAAGIRGPGGGSAGVVRGPGGGAAGYIKGPGGAGAAGVRGPYGGAAAIARLPDGSTHVAWRGSDYWYHGGYWYNPYWHDDEIWYWPCYAPVGYFTTTIDCGDGVAQPVVINGVTYYNCRDVYYSQTTQDGQAGYVVAENPNPPAAEPNAPDPFAILERGLDFLGTQAQFNMTVNDIYDEVTTNGQKVSYNTKRNIFVRRPGNVAIEFRGDDQDHRTVLAGDTLTIIDRTKNIYSQTPVPPTIDDALDTIAKKYDTSVVVAELLRADLYKRVAPNILSGQYLGQDQLTGYLCDHLAFTTENADYEFWFDAGNTPLLRRLSISYSTAPGRPRYTMVVTRFSPASMPDAAFEVRIPAGAKLVPLNAPDSATGAPAQPDLPDAKDMPLAPSNPTEMSVP